MLVSIVSTVDDTKLITKVGSYFNFVINCACLMQYNFLMEIQHQTVLITGCDSRDSKDFEGACF